MKRYLTWVIPAIASLSIAVPAGAEGYFHFGFGTGGFACEFGHYDYWGEYCDDFWDPEFEMDFYTYLEPYGRWAYVSRWGGYVWVPRVAIGWRPYTCGRWIWTEYGWTWVAYEPWGWLPHHYGHWVYDVYYGWVWVPGTTWAPAWVVWHHAPGWAGWAPMPPYWRRYYYWDGHRYHPRSRYKWKYPRYDGHLSRRSWVYVSDRDFQGRDLRSAVKEKFPGEDYRGGFEISRDGPEKREIERAIGREVRRVELEELTRQTARGDEVKVARPIQEVARTREAREAVERYVEPALDRRHRQMLRERHEAILAQREEREWRASHSRSTKAETEEQHEKVSRSAYSTEKSGEDTARHEEEARGGAMGE
jgi:hypothetical protein